MEEVSHVIDGRSNAVMSYSDRLLRSLLDFSAKMISIYIPGTSFRSISKLKNYLMKNTSNPSSSVILEEWEKWIEYLKDYRDDLIHSFCFESQATQLFYIDKIVVNGKVEQKKTVLTPGFLIPINPKFQYWIPSIETMDEDITGGSTTITTTTIVENGVIVDLDIERHFEKKSDYIEIEIFCEKYINETLSYLIKIFNLLTSQF